MIIVLLFCGSNTFSDIKFVCCSFAVRNFNIIRLIEEMLNSVAADATESFHIITQAQ